MNKRTSKSKRGDGPSETMVESPRFARQLSNAELVLLRELTKSSSSVVGAETPERLQARLEAYLDLILQWSRDSNLVGHSDLGRLVSRHVRESLLALHVLDRLAPKRILDIGSGAGFPAIPLQLARPEWTFTLIESRRRKGLFLERVAQDLELRSMRVWIGRAETAVEGVLRDGPFEVVTARAVAPTAELLEWAAPFVRPGGHAVLFKGSSYEDELAEWRKSGSPAWTMTEAHPIPESHLTLVTFTRAGSPA